MRADEEQHDAAPADAVEPGMQVEAQGGDLGEQDVSKPKVKSVERDKHGHVETVVVEKGVVFKKEIDAPADRVRAVTAGETPGGPDSGSVILDTTKSEVDDLSAVGAEALAPEYEREKQEDMAADPIAEVQRNIPTAKGLRALEADNQTPQGANASEEPRRNIFVRLLGPGLLAGMAGNDSSAVTSYSVNGAVNGYGQLWLMLISTPLLHAVMYACAKIGRVTQQGFAEILRERYGRRVAAPAALILIIANLGLIASDLAAIGSGLELITGVSWVWFVIPSAVFLWYITVYQNFETIKKIFLVMSLVFIAYLITGAFSGANWGAVLHATFVPQVALGFASVSSAVALLGATVSPYIIFWQVQGEKEEKRPGTPKQQLKDAAIDTGVGALGGNLVAYFIIVCTSATLFLHHQQVTTAADAAKALEPLLGPFAKYLFAIGFIGAGLVAIPVLLASTSYAVAGTFGWPASLWRKPWQNEGFYLILTVALAASLGLALLRIDPIQLMFWANVLQGVLTPALIICLLLVGNNRAIMKGNRLGRWANIALVLIALIMIVAATLLFYGLATGQSR